MKERKTYSILLIDDDEDDGFIFGSALKEINKSIVYVHYMDDSKALSDLKSFKLNPDYIFLDLNMPKLNGIEVLIELKTVKRLWRIPIVICTTSKEKRFVEQTKELGAAAFITKPNKIADMKTAIEDVLDSLAKYHDS